MGKSKSVVSGYHYRIAYQVGLGSRPFDAFLEYRAADKTAWAGELTSSGTIHINAPMLFGGEKDQGGIVGSIDVAFGEEDQLPNAYLQSVLGDQVVAWRGMTTLAFTGGRYGAMSPFSQKPSQKIRKILKGWDGDVCWYPERAAVTLLGELVPDENIGHELGYSGGSIPGTLYGENKAWSSINAATPIPNVCYFRLKPPSLGKANHPRRVQVYREMAGGELVWDSGWVGIEADQAALDAALLAADRTDLSGAIKVATFLDGAINFYGTPPSDLYVKFHTCATVNPELQGIMFQIYLPGVDDRLLGMNPAHMLYYCRTDSEKGREPRENINDASLAAAADRLHAEGFGLCTEYDPAKDTPDSFEERICRIIGGSFERSLVDGQWYLTLARGDYDIDSLPILGDDDILEFKELPTTLDRAVNSLSVRYFDVERKEMVITPAVRALGLIRRFGEIHETLDMPEIPDGRTAMLVCERELRARITPTRAFEITTTPVSTRYWLRNSYFRLQTLKRRIADMVCILGEKQNGVLRSGAIRIKVAQDIYTQPDTTYIEIEHGVDTRPPQTPAAITSARAFEAPYIDVCANLPRAELEVLPDDVGYLLGLAASAGSGLNYTMCVAPDGGEYAPVANGEWCPSATSAAEIGAEHGPTEVALASTDRLDQVVLGSPVLVGDEMCRVDAIDHDAPSVTLGRGCADTVPGRHAAGSRLWFFADHEAVDATEYTDGETIGVKLLTNTGSQQLPLDVAGVIPLTFTQRQARPYPPAGVLINAAPYPDTVYVTADITWAHRDRLLQADQLVDTTAASIGPEPGTTYTVRWYLDDELIEEQTGISGTSATFAPLVNGSLQIEVRSIRDGLECLQPWIHQTNYRTSMLAEYESADGDVYADQDDNIYEG